MASCSYNVHSNTQLPVLPCAVDSEDTFRARALCSIYNRSSHVTETSGSLASLPRNDDFAGLSSLESVVAQNSMEITNKVFHTTDTNVSVRWKCDLSVRATARNFHVTFLEPELSPKCIFHLEFGDNRFLMAHVPTNAAAAHLPIDRDNAHVIVTHCLNGLREQGIEFAGERFYFLGGVPSDEHGFATMWLFRPSQSISVVQARQWLLGRSLMNGNYSKMNARLKLGFSPGYPLTQLGPEQIELREDYKWTTDIDSAVMTDGCGLIHSALVATLPYGIHSGQPLKHRDDNASNDTESYLHADRSSVSSPACIQVRLRCHLGLFKGCLTVTSDSTICPENTVILRHSMRKAYDEEGPGECNLPTATTAITSTTSGTLLVTNTFEHVSALINRTPTHCHGHLNQTLCLLLGSDALGKAPVCEYLQELMMEELKELSDISKSREKAYRLVTSMLWRNNNAPVASKHIEAQALEFLMASHELNEPKLRDLLAQLKRQQLGHLKRCHIPLRQSAKLVGQPDPYNILRADEVFAALPWDHANTHCPSMAVIEGRVLVTRDPHMHPGDLGVFTAVRCERHIKSLLGSSGGVVYFSTQALQSPVTRMGGGDYDGDVYDVIFDKKILEHIEEAVKPFDYLDSSSTAQPNDALTAPPINSTDITVLATNLRVLCFDSSHPKPAKFHELPLSPAQPIHIPITLSTTLDNLFQALLALVANSRKSDHYVRWLSYADLDPMDSSAQIYLRLFSDDMDAGKTGLLQGAAFAGYSSRMENEFMNLRDQRKLGIPHYWHPDSSGNNESQRNRIHSRSIVGRLYDLVACEDTFTLGEDMLVTDFSLDPDLLVVKNFDDEYSVKCCNELPESDGRFYGEVGVYAVINRRHSAAHVCMISYFSEAISMIAAYTSDIAKACDDRSTSDTLYSNNAKNNSNARRLRISRVQTTYKAQYQSLLQKFRDECLDYHRSVLPDSEIVLGSLLASVFYCAAYSSSRRLVADRPYTGSGRRNALSPANCCWELCGATLHETKARKKPPQLHVSLAEVQYLLKKRKPQK